MPRPDVIVEYMPDTDPAGVIEALVDRIFHSSHSTIERVDEGVSTRVYRVRRAGETFYLRVLPEQGASFMPEARVHALLRERGVKVPEVVYVEHYDDALQRSVMVTTEIEGQHVGRHPAGASTRQVLVEAGRDLALINGVPVEGFGWITRDSPTVTPLTAEHPTYRAFALDGLEDDLALIGARVLGRGDIEAVRAIFARYDALLDAEGGRLAHGDFDVSHIYQLGGRYSGIIDFGEIRGADPYYDLGHFMLHDGETLPIPALPYLLEGYKEVAALPPDAEQRIRFAGLLIALKALARQLRKSPHLRGQSYVSWLSTAIKGAMKSLWQQ